MKSCEWMGHHQIFGKWIRKWRLGACAFPSRKGRAASLLLSWVVRVCHSVGIWYMHFVGIWRNMHFEKIQVMSQIYESRKVSCWSHSFSFKGEGEVCLIWNNKGIGSMCMKKKSISDSYKLKVEWKFGSKILIFVFINSNLLFARIRIDMTIRITLANEEKCTSDWRMLMGFAHLPWEGLWEFTWAVSKLAALIVGIHFSLEKRIASYFSLILKALGRTWRVFESLSWAPQAFPWCPGVATVSKRGSERPACWFPRSFYAKWLARSAFTEVPHSSWGSQMQGDYLWKKHPTQTK